MNEQEQELITAMQRLAPGVYTERDSGPWYVVTPNHCDRIAEDFTNRNDARRIVLWLAGDDMPAGWSINASGDGELAYDLVIPGRPRATLWARTCRKLFPARATELRKVK